MPRIKKLRIIRGLIIAKSLYGTEAAEPSCKRIDALTTAIVKAMGIRNETRSLALAFEATQEAGDLDPRINMLVRKVILLRRIIARRPDMQVIISGIIDEYNTLYANSPMSTLPSNKLPCRGPVGLLVLHLRASGMCINNELVISRDKVRVLNVMRVPWQEVKPRIIYITRQNRHETTKLQRSELAEAGPFGHEILDRAMAKLTEEDRRTLISQLTLGRFEEKHVLRFNQNEIVKCPYCNKVGYDAAHVAWLCPRLDVERYVWREVKRTKQQKDENEPRK